MSSYGNEFSATTYQGGSQKYIDVEQMENCLNEIMKQISNLKTATESYDSSAPSLEGSTFKGAVEGLMAGIKKPYENMATTLDSIQSKVVEVKDTYFATGNEMENIGNTN